MRPDPLAAFPARSASAVPAVTGAQMREVDRLAMQDAGLSLPQMMENAGRALASLVRHYLIDASTTAESNVAGDTADSGAAPPAGPVLVLAGRGGNGGGALAAARHLRNWGYAVQITLSAPPGNLDEAAAGQLHILHKDGLRALWPASPEFDDRLPRELETAAVVVDGLVGYSLRGSLEGDVALLVEAVLDRAPPVVTSLDIPSGFDATTSAVSATGIVATATLTLALPKSGLFKSDASAAVGELLLADIGIPNYIYERLGIEGVRGIFAEGPIVRLHWTY